jgi:hypothetical protein
MGSPIFPFTNRLLILVLAQRPDLLQLLLGHYKLVNLDARPPVSKPVRVSAVFQRLIPTDERCGLLTHIVTTESVSLGVLMKS